MSISEREAVLWDLNLPIPFLGAGRGVLYVHQDGPKPMGSERHRRPYPACQVAVIARCGSDPMPLSTESACAFAVRF